MSPSHSTSTQTLKKPTNTRSIIYGTMCMGGLVIFVFSFLACIFTPLESHAATVSKSVSNLGIVGWWPMNEGTSTIAHDISTSGRNATLTNISAPATASSGWTLAGKRGQAIRFDGTDDYLNIGSFPTLNSGTLSAWVKRSGTTGTYQMIFTDSGSELELTFFSNQLQFYVNNVGLTYNGASTLDTWYHIVGTFDSVTGTKLYVNGVLVNSSGTYPGAAGTATKYIGGRGVGFPFNGTIDDLRVYDRELSSAEVMTLYRSGEVVKKTASNNGLVGYWSMDEGTSTIAHDFSGNNYFGTLSNFALSGLTSNWGNGKRGGALDFDGSNDQVYGSIPASTFSGDFTIAAWFNHRAMTQWGAIFSNSVGTNETAIMTMRDTTTQMGIMRVGVLDSGVFVDLGADHYGKWIFAVITRQGSNLSVHAYKDGQLISSTGTLSWTLNTDNEFYIGRHYGSATHIFNGKIDEVRVYNRALSMTEIDTLYKQDSLTINHTQTDRLTDGLMGMWSFNGRDMNWTSASAGVAYDRSGNNNTGTLTNMTQSASPASGRVGQALTFNGSTSYVQIPYSATLAPTSAISFGGWMKTRDKTLSQKMMSKTETGGYAIVINEAVGGCSATSLGGFVGVDVAGVNTYYGACYDRSNLTNNKWHHVMVSYDSETLRLYLDGVEVATNSTPTGPVKYSSANTLCIGTEPSATCGVTQFWPGDIDEVRVYNRVLSASEIKQLYLMGK